MNFTIGVILLLPFQRLFIFAKRFRWVLRGFARNDSFLLISLCRLVGRAKCLLTNHSAGSQEQNITR